MFHSSSRSNNRPNADGTVNLFCCTCGEFVSRGTIIMRVQCELCRRAENGEELTAEMIATYQQGKKPPSAYEISMVVLPSVPGKEEKKFKLGNMTGNILEAVGIKRKKKKASPSQVASKEQRRGRIFDGVTLADSLGNMAQVDEDLKRDK